MKRIILLIGLVVSLFSVSCQKDLEPVLGDPDQRQSEALMAYQTLLTSSEFGWNGYIYTKLGGGYSFHFDFQEDGQVNMQGDLNDKTMEVGTSTWRLKSSQQSLLIFDTYSYLHWLSDPDAGVFQGAPGQGLGSDYEFAFLGVSENQDTIHFQGKLNKVDFLLVRSSKADADSWATGAVLQIEDQIKIHRFASSGDGFTMMVNPEKKTALFRFKPGAEPVSIPYTYTRQGINLQAPVVQQGYGFNAVFWDEEKGLYYVQSQGSRIDLPVSDTPLFSLDELLGYGKAYDRLVFDGDLLDPTLSSGLQARWDQAKANNILYMGPPVGRELLDYAVMQFVDDDEVSVHFRYKHPIEGTLFTVGIWYHVQRNSDNRLEFTYIRHDNNTLFNDPRVMQPFTTDFFEAKSFILDYLSREDKTSLVGAIIDQEDSGDFFYGILN